MSKEEIEIKLEEARVELENYKSKDNELLIGYFQGIIYAYEEFLRGMK